MKTFELECVYGSSHTKATLFTAETSRGTWYAIEGSMNVNFTTIEVHNGIDVEEIPDDDMLTSAKPINSVEDLENAIND